MASSRRRAAGLAAVALTLLLAAALLAPLAGAAPPPGSGELTITPTAVGFGATTVGTNSNERQIEVRNESGVVVTISNVDLQGAEPSEFSTGQDSCVGATLGGGGQSCTIGVYFSPHGTGAKEALLRITSSDMAGQENVELTGTGAAPQLSFEPGSFDFGLQPTHGEGDAETEFQLRNSGAATIHLDNIGFEGSGANSFNTGNSNCFGANLTPGESCYLQIRFRPQETIPYAANLRVAANGTNFTAALAGEGGEAVITATPSPVRFGTAAVGSSGVTQTVTLANSGDLPTGFFIAFLTGGDVEDFRLLSEDCTAGPLDPGSSCTARVRFQPSSAGAATSKLTFIAGGEGGPLQIDLDGTGVASALSLDPGALSFGTQAIGGTSPSQPLTLSNGGASPVEVGAASIIGPGSDQFRLSDSCSGVVLAPGASCQAAVRFAPVSPGAASATLRIPAGGKILSAQLSGSAVAPAQVRLRLGSKLPQVKGAALSVGELGCEAASKCVVRIRATINGLVRTSGGNRQRNITLASRRLQVAAGETPTLRLRLGAAARRLLDERVGAAHLNLHFSWSSEGHSGSGMIRRQIGRGRR